MQLSRTNFTIALLSAGDQAGLPAGFNVQLLPWGDFRALDGRPAKLKHWTFNDVSAQAVLALFKGRKREMPFDYEHQTQLSATNGQPAPASGWVKDMVAIAGRGLYAAVEWTAKAKAMIEAKEYRYVSPVISYDEDGVIRRVAMGALTNDPGLVLGEVTLTAVDDGNEFPNQPTGERSMSELLVSLRAALGFTAETTADSCLAAVTALKAKADEVNASATQLATLKANQFDAAKHVPVEVHQAISTELATLKASASKAEQSSLIEALLKAGKLVPAQKAWAETQTVESLKAFTKDAPAVVPGSTQSDGKGAQAPSASGLNEEQLKVCKALGLKPDDYAKRLAAEVAV